MINNEQPGSLNATVLLLWLTAASSPNESDAYTIVWYGVILWCISGKKTCPRCNNDIYGVDRS